MAVQTATIATASQADWIASLQPLARRIQEHSPGAVRTTTLTVVTDTAGTIVTTLTDSLGNTYVSRFVATVA